MLNTTSVQGNANQPTLRYHFIFIKIAIIKKGRTTSIGEDVEKVKPLHTACRNVKWHNHCGKFCQLLKKLNIELPYDPVIPLLGTYLKELKAETPIDTCHSLQYYSQWPKSGNNSCPSTDQQLSKIWYICMHL